MELISDFGIQLNQKKRKEKLDQANAMGGDVLRIINDHSNNSHSDGGNSNHDSRSVTSNPSMHSNPNSNRNVCYNSLYLSHHLLIVNNIQQIQYI